MYSFLDNVTIFGVADLGNFIHVCDHAVHCIHMNLRGWTSRPKRRRVIYVVSWPWSITNSVFLYCLRNHTTTGWQSRNRVSVLPGPWVAFHKLWVVTFPLPLWLGECYRFAEWLNSVFLSLVVARPRALAQMVFPFRTRSEFNCWGTRLSMLFGNLILAWSRIHFTMRHRHSFIFDTLLIYDSRSLSSIPGIVNRIIFVLTGPYVAVGNCFLDMPFLSFEWKSFFLFWSIIIVRRPWRFRFHRHKASWVLV